ncbi:MAG: hypothetical protein IJ837_01250 [Clostridia bacterium]|nr:hypothetical protein [Clostridia bacterium]
MAKNMKKENKSTKKERIVFVNNPKFDAAVLKILAERQKMFEELAK